MSDVKYCCASCGSFRILHNTWEAYNPEDMPWGWQVGNQSKDWCHDCVDFCQITERNYKNPEGVLGGSNSATKPTD